MTNDGFFNLDLGFPDQQRTIPPRKRPVRRRKEFTLNSNLGGDGEKNVLFVSNNIFIQEDKEFLLKQTGMSPYEFHRDCIFFQIEKGKLTTGELSALSYKLTEIIQDRNISIVIPMGEDMVKAVIVNRLEGRLTGTQAKDFFGECIPDQELKVWICPTYSSENLLSQTTYEHGIPKMLLKSYRNDIAKALSFIGKSFPVVDQQKNIHTTTDCETAMKWITQAMKDNTVLGFDYETTGLKPHGDKQKIVSMSISNGRQAWAFPCFNNRDFRECWCYFLYSNVEKVIHKMDFEIMWSSVFFLNMQDSRWGKVNNVVWDTCLGAHFLHNQKSTGQKFLVYTHFGVLNYDDEVDQYLKPDTDIKKQDGGNALNNIENAPMDKVLMYNGFDSLYMMHLYFIQKNKIKSLGSKYQRGWKFFLEGADALAQVQLNGIHIDTRKLLAYRMELNEQIKDLEQTLYNSSEVKQWKEETPFKVTSHVQLRKLLYDILGYTRPAAGESFTDEYQLRKLNTTFTSLIISLRKKYKMVNTYLAQFLRENTNSFIYPFYNLNIPVTYRSSSTNPNFQNLPARDPEALEKVLSGIIPRPHNKIIEWDYKGIEVVIACCYHNDPNMKKYIMDTTTDMHRDTAADILLKRSEEITAQERFTFGKSGFVFPSFYGSGAQSIATTLWEKLQEKEFAENKAYLRSKKIRNYSDFYNHIQSVYRIFWNERFPVYSQWKQTMYDEYLRTGMVPYHTGFMYQGYAGFTKITNAPIQGSAFHVLLWSLIHIRKEFRERNLQSKIIGQIHDAIVADVVPEEEALVDAIVRDWGTKRVKEHWPWITLPLTLEKEATEIDGSWNTLQSVPFKELENGYR